MSDTGRMSMSAVMDRLRDASDGDRMTIGDIFDAFGTRAYGPLIFVLGVIALSPIGSIPGASIITGTLIVLLAAQMLFRSGAPWAPGFLRRVGVGGESARKSVDWADRYVSRMDKVVGPRWEWVEQGWVIRLSGIVIAALAASFYPLAFVPWGVVPPGVAVTLLALGIFSRDGMILAIGLASAIAAAGASWYFLM